MTDEKPTATKCPNCQQPAIRTGNEIACENCDATFIVTKKQGAKLKQIGPIEDHEQRIKRLESLLPGEEQASDDEPQEQPEDEEKEEPFLPK